MAYQDLASGRKEVDAGFMLSGDGVVRFRLGDYAPGAPLVIDPVFVFSTYLDGTGAGAISAVATDSAGNIYVTGETTSTDFPTLNAEQSQLSSLKSAFVTKLDPTGTKLIYSTYLGGSNTFPGNNGTTIGAAIAVDASDDAIVAGVVTESDFPQAGAMQLSNCGGTSTCYFLASLSPDGSKLNYAGEINGGVANYGSNGVLAVDSAGNAYLAGVTSSSSFQITTGTLSSSVPNYPYSTMFVMKVDPTGKLLYSTVITGNAVSNSFIPYSLAVDATGQATIAGTAAPGLPTTAGVVQQSFPNTVSFLSTAGFVLQLNATASAINYASYLPGTDAAGGMAVGPSGNLYFVGATSETNLPVAATAYERTVDAGYVMELSAGAASVKAATYFKGFTMSVPYSISAPMGIALDNSGNVFVAGMTQSTAFPMVDPFTPVFLPGFAMDLAVAEFKSDLSSLQFGSFLSSTDAIYPVSTFGAMTVDKNNDLILAGTTTALDFPTTPGSYEPELPPSQDPGYNASTSSLMFIAKINTATPAGSACLDTYSVASAVIVNTVNVTNCGNALLHISSVSSSDPSYVPSQSCGAIAVGSSCPVTVYFSPLRSGTITGTISINDDAANLQQKVTFSGGGVSPSLVPPVNPFSVGHQVVGTNGTSTMTILNYGGAEASISGITVNGGSFSVSGYTCYSISVGGSCTLKIVFAPQTTGTITGSLVIVSNDLVNPHLVVDLVGVGDSAYLAPSIDTLSPTIALINSGSVAIQIFGNNFYPSSVVQVKGAAQASKYVSNSEIDITLPAPAVIGQIPTTVVNPSPGGTSAPVSFTPYQILGIQPASLAYVSSTGLLYAAMPSGASSNPNTVIPITPATGALGTPIPVGNNPSLLAASSDGQYLYVALASGPVQRINLSTQGVERTFPSSAANDLQAVPGVPQEVVVAQGAQLSLYNDSGLVNSVSFGGPDTFDSIAFAGNPLTVYGINHIGWTNTFTAVNLTSSGLQLPGVTFGAGYTGFTGSTVVSDGTLLYTNAGQVRSPASQTEVGAFPLNTAYSISSYPLLHNIAMDASLGKIFAIDIYTSDNGTYSAAIAAYNSQPLQITGELDFPQTVFPQISNLVRWGSDGFAFITATNGLATPGVYLIRSSLVSSSSTSPAPLLNSLSPNSAYAGTTNTTLTLTVNGTGFTPASVIYWNGATLTTNFVSGVQLTAVVSNSLIASVATAQVTVVTPAPGGGTSNALPFAITSGQPTATPSSTALDFGSIQVGNSSSAQYISITNHGPRALIFSSLSASGDYSSPSTCISNLSYLSASYSCQIAVVFTPTTTGLRTGAITITNNAGDSPQIIRLTGTGAPVSA